MAKSSFYQFFDSKEALYLEPAEGPAESVYFDTISQMVVDGWSRGQVVLLGDAAWCVTLFAGFGSSLAAPREWETELLASLGPVSTLLRRRLQLKA